MAAEHQPSEAPISVAPLPTANTADPSPEPPQIDAHAAATAAAPNPPKRQRRPSVRLGEIGGDAIYETHQRRPNRTWRYHKDPSLASKSSKIKPLTNVVNGGASGGGGAGGGDSNFQDSVELSENFSDFSHRKPKIKKPTKKARTNWNKFDTSAVNNGGAGGGAGIIDTPNFFPDENDNHIDEFRELEVEDSESPLPKEQQSPINSTENMGLHFWDQQRRENRSHHSESNGVHHNEVNSPEKRSNDRNSGVRQWLSGLGLEKYAPVFEIHEVDEEVLSMLTLEDLKDMGINAVGSRRKMYSSILKLRKGFS